MDLDNFRKEVDRINEEILDLLKQRIEISKKIGNYKKQSNLAILDENREKEIFDKLDILAEEKGLDNNFIRNLFELIIEQSKKEQI